VLNLSILIVPYTAEMSGSAVYILESLERKLMSSVEMWKGFSHHQGLREKCAGCFAFSSNKMRRNILISSKVSK
jgi:hypothetical protein